MAFGIYKQGQGFWTRGMSFAGGVILFGWGAAWIAGEISKFTFPKRADGSYVVEPQFVQGGASILALIIGAAVCYWLSYSKPSSSEFLIATDGEMRKVNWSTRKEVIGSTWVVIAIALLLAGGIFLVDLGFSRFFQFIRVLNPPQ